MDSKSPSATANQNDPDQEKPLLDLEELKKKFIYVEPTGEHKYTLIFLHGLGDSAKGIHKYFGIKGSPLKISNMRIVLPTAPRRNMTVNKMQMNSWYDIYHSWKSTPAGTASSLE